MFWVDHKSVVGVLQSCDCCNGLSAQLEDLFRVVSDIVCEVGGNMFVFRF